MSAGTPLWPGTEPRPGRVDLLAVGQNALDRVVSVDAMPPPGGRVRVEPPRELPGGPAATAALCCARLGLNVAYAGAVGDDAAGRVVLEPLRREGIDLAGVATVPGAATQTAVILVERETGERTVFWHRDARLRPTLDAPLADAIAGARAVLVDDGDPELAAWVAGRARDADVPVLLDADGPPAGLEALLALVDFPIVSQAFADSFKGSQPLDAALAWLLSWGARLAIVTRGERGAVAQTPERRIESPAFVVDAVDTTGAGDVFRAGFVWGLLQGLDAEGVLRAANAAAALNCRALGAQGGLPDRVALEALLEAG
jgi:sulfofructose kinase